MSITQFTEQEQRLTSMLRTCTEALKQVTAERDALAAELASLRDSFVKVWEPEPNQDLFSGQRVVFESYDIDQLRDYGDRRAMAALKTSFQHSEAWESNAKRLALELECLLMSCDLPAASKWWDSAHEAMELHRQLIRDIYTDAENCAEAIRKGEKS